MELDVYSASAVELIKWLHSTYPHRCIGASEAETSAQRYAGKRELVDELLTLLESAYESGELPSVSHRRDFPAAL